MAVQFYSMKALNFKKKRFFEVITQKRTAQQRMKMQEVTKIETDTAKLNTLTEHVLQKRMGAAMTN